MNKPLLAAYRYTTNNWDMIQGSQVCGCCNCMRIFPASEVSGWTGLALEDIDDPAAIAKQTAMCPHCGSESVLGDQCGYPIDAAFLSRMNEAWLQQTAIRPLRPPA